jgi:hypothetical protein
MAENWLFNHNSVRFEHFYALFCDLSLFLNRTYFIEEKIVVRFKLTSDSKIAAEFQRSITLEFASILRSALCNMNQEHILSNYSKMVDRSNKADQNQIF